MSSKDAPQKMQFLDTIKKLASLFPGLQNAKWRKEPTDSTVVEPECVGIPICLHIPRGLEQAQRCRYGFIANTGLFVRCRLRTNCYLSKIPFVQAKNHIITVSVFLSTLQLTALLLKNFRLCLHCYNLGYPRR